VNPKLLGQKKSKFITDQNLLLGANFLAGVFVSLYNILLKLQ